MQFCGLADNSSGADEMVSAGRERGKTIFFDKSEIPLVFKKSMISEMGILTRVWMDYWNFDKKI